MSQSQLSQREQLTRESESTNKLLVWLAQTMVNVNEYGGESEQPIRNLFGKLLLFYEFIQHFITLRKENRGISQETLSLMESFIDTMSKTYANVPRKTSSDEYKFFFENTWKPMIREQLRIVQASSILNDKSRKFLVYFLKTYGDLYGDKIDFDITLLKHFVTLFSKINELDEDTLGKLYETYCQKNGEYYKWYSRWQGGGRKLSRRRKSNAKTKSKHNKRRRRKSSHRRQRH